MMRQWKDDGWRKRFAVFPIFLSDGPNRQVIWLQWHWRKFNGLYIEISLENPHLLVDNVG